MNEFVKKLIERLKSKHVPYLGMDNSVPYGMEMVRLFEAIEIANQLAEEYTENLADVDDEQTINVAELVEGNDGWIPCGERLPKLYERVQVTHLGYHDSKPYANGNTAFIDETGCWCWTKGSHPVCVPIVAWRENLPAPYQPKGE